LALPVKTFELGYDRFLYFAAASVPSFINSRFAASLMTRRSHSALRGRDRTASSIFDWKLDPNGLIRQWAVDFTLRLKLLGFEFRSYDRIWIAFGHIFLNVDYL
jgi:hypothetical protein